MGAVLAAIVFKSGSEQVQISKENEGKSLWDIELTDINNNKITLRQIVKGKKAVLIVNTASK